MSQIILKKQTIVRIKNNHKGSIHQSAPQLSCTKNTKSRDKDSFCLSRREPKDSISSFYNYQERNPLWYPNFSKDAVLDMYSDAYDTINFLSENEPGIVIDYRQLISNFQETINKIYNYLWKPNRPTEDNFNRKISKFASNSPAIKDKYNKRQTGNIQKPVIM